MIRANDISNDFSDWCYNRAVEAAHKREITQAFLMITTLQKHIEYNLQSRKFKTQASAAKRNYNALMKAFKNHTYMELELTGQEFIDKWNADKQQRIDYLKSLGIEGEI